MDVSVNLDAYQHGVNFADDALNQANLTSEQLANLTKALEAGDLQGGALNNPNQTNGGALKLESLEKNLKLITFRESDIRFWKRFPKAAAFNTVEEYNQQTSYGTDRGGFNNEGELPEEEDSQYRRKAQLVKYLGVTKSVTHQMQLVATNVGSIMQKETTNGILWILRKANRALFHANSAMISQEWNGLSAQHGENDAYPTMEEYYTSQVIIDLRGKTLREGNIEEGCQVILNKFGQADLLIAPPVVLSDFAAGFYDAKRIMVGQPNAVNNATMGQHVSKFQSMYGLIDFEYDIFAAKPAGKLSSAAATSPKAPTAPTAGVAPAVGADALTRFTDGAGNYYYAVTAINRYGESAMTQLGATVAVTIADSVDLDFAATAGAYQPTAYRVYRSLVNPAAAFGNTVMYPLFDVAATGTSKFGSLAAGVDGAAAGLVRDRNRWVGATEEAWLLQADTDVIEFKQLAPLMKMPIAKLSPADRFMVLLYGTPLLYAPDKMVRYINVGRDAS